MLTERLEILVTREQRRRLELEALREGISVGALVRQAIDARVGTTASEERLRAVEAIKALTASFVPPDKLERLIGEERTRASG